MTFLQYSSGIGKKSIIALIIMSCIALTVFAQKTTPQQQGKRYGEAGFVGEAINLNVTNADIRDILNYITEQYGVNFVIDKSVQKVPVTVNISDVPWNIALDSILRSQELGVQVNGPILRIADTKTIASERKIQQEIEEAKIDNSVLYTEFIRLNYARANGQIQASGFTSGTSSSSSSGTGSGSSTGSGASSGGSGEGLLPIIKRRISRRGSVEVDARSNSLIITDVRENIDAIRQLVAILDQPEPQVEIEARIVIASRDFSRDIGVQLSALVLGNRNGVGFPGAVGSTLPGNPGNPSNAPVPTGALASQPNSNLASQLANSVIGLTTGVFGTAQINLLLTAGEKKGQSKTLATPRVTTLNNRQATIESGQQIPIVTSQVGSGGAGTVFTTTYVSVPLKLEVTPQITDAGTVLLNVSVENSSVSSTIAVGGTPGINTTRMKNEVMVPDGGTTVVGGALLDVEGETNFNTPGLSKLPVIGNLFKRKAVAKTTNEVLFFITPRIYRPDYEGNPTSGKVSTGTRSTTIIQPVPLGNPPSNSSNTPETQPVIIPGLPIVQPSATPKP
jgi:type IV pilus assembly protein PilQ